MVAVAAVALVFAVLPMAFAVPLAIAVFGIIVLDGMHLPIVTDWDGRWGWLPWVLWLSALAACPVAMIVVAVTHVSPPHPSGPPPWAFHLVGGLFTAHLAVSVVAAIAVVVLARGGWRWLFWAALLPIGVMAAYVCLCAEMATSGWSL
jgi:hypothetical protein